MLNFKKVEITDSEILIPHLNKYSQDSCQHSFSLMMGLSEKYGDEFCFVGNVLFVHRSKQDTESKRVYLAPLGELSDNPKLYIDMLLEDAADHNCKLSFETVTDNFVKILEEYYPERFEITGSRDMAEYIYTTSNMVVLPGSKLAAKRNRINAFNSAYENVVVEMISTDNFEDVRTFQTQWHAERTSYEADPRLDIENDSINMYLDNYDRMHFSGIIVYVDRSVAGYAAGVPLSGQCMDEVIEKGDRNIIGIYQVLCREFARLCCEGYKYINREEDIGIEGLRRAKESYKPDHLIDKYYASEK